MRIKVIDWSNQSIAHAVVNSTAQYLTFIDVSTNRSMRAIRKGDDRIDIYFGASLSANLTILTD